MSCPDHKGDGRSRFLLPDGKDPLAARRTCPVAKGGREIALYHFSVTQIKRSEGKSAIAAAAYRAGEKLHSEYYGNDQDYRRKSGVICSEILLPPHAPERFKDRETLWNEVEKIEKHPKAQLAYSFDIALQNEFTREENMVLARQFLQDEFVSRAIAKLDNDS